MLDVRFKAPWPPIENTRIIRRKQKGKSDYKRSKILDNILHKINSTPDLNDVTLQDLLDSCNITREQYFEVLDQVQNSLKIMYKRQPNETNIGPYNTVMLSILQSNMNIQFVINMYAVLAYITSYMCKSELI